MLHAGWFFFSRLVLPEKCVEEKFLGFSVASGLKLALSPLRSAVGEQAEQEI